MFSKFNERKINKSVKLFPIFINAIRYFDGELILDISEFIKHAESKDKPT